MVFGLILLISLLLYLPPVQNFIVDKATESISSKINTPFTIGHLYLDFPSGVSIEKVYAEDQSGDTLLYLGDLEVDIDLLALLHNEVEVSNFELSNTLINLKVGADSSFNFQYIIDAMAPTDSTQTASPQDTTTSSGMQFDVGEVLLENVRFNYYSLVDGMQTGYNVGRLYLDVKELNLDSQIYLAHEISLSNASGNFELFKEVVSATDSSTGLPKMTVGADELNIEKVSFDFNDSINKTFFSSAIGELYLESEPMVINQQSFTINDLTIDDSQIAFRLGKQIKPIDDFEKEDNPQQSDDEWAVILEKGAIQNLDFLFQDENAEAVEKGFDPANLDLNIASLLLKDAYYKGIDDIGIDLQELDASGADGLALQSDGGHLKLDSTSLKVENFNLKTNNSELTLNTELAYSSFDELSKNPLKANGSIDLNQMNIGINDVNYFVPGMDTLIGGLKNEQLSLGGVIEKNNNTLNFKQVGAQLLNNTKLKLNGSIANIEDDPTFSLSKINLQTTNTELKKILPSNTIPSNIQLPGSINFSGNLNGSLNDLKSDFDLMTSIGDVSADLALQHMSDSLRLAEYQLNTTINNFDLGYLIQDTTFGTLNFEGEVVGEGLSAENMNVKADAILSQFTYADYTYSDLDINGTISDQRFEGSFSMNDSNLIFSFNGLADLDSTLPKFDFDLNVVAADLQHLNLYEEDVRFAGKISAELEGNNLNNINGDIDAREVVFIHQDETYHVDSLLFLSITDSVNTDISIASTLFDAQLKGKIKLADLGATLERYFNSYLPKAEPDSVRLDQDFVFDIKIHDPDLLTEVLLPDLDNFESGLIHGEFDSKKHLLNIDIEFPKINYLNISIDSLIFKTRSDQNSFNADFNLKSAAIDTIALKNLSNHTELINDSILNKLQIRNDTGGIIMQLFGYIDQLDGENYFALFKDEQILAYDKWEVTPTNKIIFGELLRFEDLNFNRSEESLSLNTKDQKHYINFQNFKIASISSIIQIIEPKAYDVNPFADKPENRNDSSINNTLLIDGEVNGTLILAADSTSYLKSDIKINDLSLVEVPIGDLKLQATTNSKNVTNATLNLSGQGNELQSKARFGGDKIMVESTIEKLQMKTIEALSSGQLKDAKGYISGQASLEGTTKDPKFGGQLSFNQVKLFSTYLGERYHFNDETITFRNEQLKLNQFTVLDSSNQKMIIDGSINFKELNNPAFQLKLTADDFQYLNTSKESKNDLFYGSVLLSTETTVRGDLELPIINSTITLEEGTNITFVLPEQENVAVSQEGIVTFVDKDGNIPYILREEKNQDTVELALQGVELTAAITIKPEVEATMIIDPITGDRLEIQGGGQLRTDIDKAGNISLNGRYTIQEGSYELRLYNLVKRSFELNEGSSISWSGDPLDATMNIRGVYTVDAAPIGLLGSQVTGLSESEQFLYRNQIPFQVILILEGELMQPLISFELDVEDDEKGQLEGAVMAKINELNEDESELNKQVFSLIVLKRFLTEDPLSSGGSGGSAARQSVSKLLNQQLNSLTDNYIKGFKVDLGVDSYESYNAEGEQVGRTEVNLGVSKTLFNDRVTIRLQGDFDVEGDAAQSGSNSMAGDVAFIYKITEDGRFKMKLYRDNQYAGILEGEIIETGVALVYTKDYEKFKDLFTDKNKARREDEE